MPIFCTYYSSVTTGRAIVIFMPLFGTRITLACYHLHGSDWSCFISVSGRLAHKSIK